MLVKEYKCDWCGKTTPDYSMEPGWIHINNHNLKITNGDKYARLTSVNYSCLKAGALLGSIEPRPAT